MRIKSYLASISDVERREFVRYLKLTGALDLARELYGLESLEITPEVKEIYLPKERQVFKWNHRDTGGMRFAELSKKELHLLLQGFYSNEQDRTYIIDSIFYKNNFLSKNQWDILDYLEQVERLFEKVSMRRRWALYIVDWVDEKQETGEDAANDAYYTPLVERIGESEVGYFDYVHEVYQARLGFVESIFCEVVKTLADNPKNHIWALDPTSVDFYISPNIQNKIDLIRSICEFHRTVDSHFPALHTLIKSTVASWILVYRGFSAPVEQVRSILNKK